MSEEGQLPYKSSSVNNELCLEGQFCDAIIKVEDVEFPVHRIILCNCTPYFRALFTHCSDPDKQVFNIPGLSSEMMALIINFAYTGSVSITGENVVELLMAADQFNAMDIVKLCSDFLGEQLCPENCVGIWQFTKVRLGLMTSDYLKDNVLSSELVEANSECLSMISNAILDIHDLGSRPFMSALYHPLARPRLPHSILLAIGGWSGGEPTNGIEAYDCRANRWVNVTNNLECPRAYHGAAFLNGYVYSVGGFDGVEHFNSVRRFDLTTHAWNEVAPMHSRRCYVSVTVLNGFIYALGGHDGHVRLSSAERYQPEINQWSLIAPMHEQRSHASCTTLNNRIYICGGLNGNECLQTAEYYNPESNQWTMISPMNSRRSGIGVIAYADHVFAVGGFDGNNYLRTAEAYNPHTNTWNLVFSMLTPRSNFGIEVIDDRLFVVGGFNGFTTTSDVEYYTALTNEWYEACDMDIFRTDLSCCVMSGLSNLTEYTFPRDFLPLEDVLKLAMESAEST
ncbi:kelch-like protein 10 isoform X2 [Maylandia zebra]|uniref:kelch-like protein 10 isoform X2 n=1 Tax=Maylandia zebra TaxID=106582 RepID=UPI00403C3543